MSRPFNIDGVKRDFYVHHGRIVRQTGPDRRRPTKQAPGRESRA